MVCHKLNIGERTFSRWKNQTTPLGDQQLSAIRPAPSNKLTLAE